MGVDDESLEICAALGWFPGPMLAGEFLSYREDYLEQLPGCQRPSEWDESAKDKLVNGFLVAICDPSLRLTKRVGDLSNFGGHRIGLLDRTGGLRSLFRGRRLWLVPGRLLDFDRLVVFGIGVYPAQATQIHTAWTLSVLPWTTAAKAARAGQAPSWGQQKE